MNLEKETFHLLKISKNFLSLDYIWFKVLKKLITLTVKKEKITKSDCKVTKYFNNENEIIVKTEINFNSFIMYVNFKYINQNLIYIMEEINKRKIEEKTNYKILQML